MTNRSPFRHSKTSPEIICLAVTLYARFPLSLRNVEDLLHERGIDVTDETVRICWNRFGPLFAAEIRRRRVDRMRSGTHWRWHLDEVFVKIKGERHYLLRAVDHEGEVLESYATKRRDRNSALKVLRKLMKRFGKPQAIVTDKCRSYGAASKDVGNAERHATGRWLNNRAENSRLFHFDYGNGPCCVSGACEVCGNSSPFMPQSTIISTRNVISKASLISS